MNPFCPYCKCVLRQTREAWKCPQCEKHWKKGIKIMEKLEEHDTLSFLKYVLKVSRL